MKCPKCGSDKLMIERRPNGYTTCLKCAYKWKHTKEDVEKAKYQQRLDNVLSKFDKISPIGLKLYEKHSVYMVYIKDKFVLNGAKFLSLNTVESLIKDLEDEN